MTVPIRDARPVAPARGTVRGVGLGEVTLAPGFWADRQRTNSAATLAHAYEWVQRVGWVANFDAVAAGESLTERPGWQFSDSEVYKLIEALAWEWGRTADPGVEAMLTDLTHRVAAAQDDDGYLNTAFGHPGRPPRYTDMEMGHELYCVGHLLQAAVARVRTVGSDLLVEVARKAADHVCREFGVGARETVCGHPEIEVGLAELGRALAEPRYLEQAALILDRRGKGLLRPLPLLGPEYFQDDQPVRTADVWRGHAVRALYLSAAAVDVAVDLADHDLLSAVERQWARSVQRRTYITGGMGSRHQDEGFGEDWELPADRAYCETCAGVASIMVSWRLYLATGEVRYPDLIERTLFNVVATSPREDGRAFFYANPLQQRVPGTEVPADQVNPRAEGGVRAPWFEVSCCPTNVARTLASWQCYAASVDGDVVSLLQYTASSLEVALAGGGSVGLQVRTDYPRGGVIEVEVTGLPDREVALRLRVP
ncbi:MAG TPA: glycoside hydrolase family 127 protein, partial [Actinotalea sp.]|nr:glycoside hydrolase family 127 protein [Actinotalea sp.]